MWLEELKSNIMPTVVFLMQSKSLINVKECATA